MPNFKKWQKKFVFQSFFVKTEKKAEKQPLFPDYCRLFKNGVNWGNAPINRIKLVKIG